MSRLIRTRGKLIPVVLFVTVAGLSACSAVAPWERGVLAQTEMSTEPAPLQQMRRNHVYNSREAAASVETLNGGGGCGCY